MSLINNLLFTATFLKFIYFCIGNDSVTTNFITQTIVTKYNNNRTTRELLKMNTTNDITNCPQLCKCFKSSSDSVLTVNCSNARLREMPVLPLPGQYQLDRIELFIENSNLNTLPIITKATETGYAFVTALYASGNNISSVKVKMLPPKLQYLDLSRNQLEQLGDDTINFLVGIQDLRLSANPWRCDCETVQMFQLEDIIDYNLMQCSNLPNATKFTNLTANDLCSTIKYPIIVLVISVTIIVIALFLCLLYKEYIKLYLFTYKLCKCCVGIPEIDNDKTYDAFIAFSEADGDFVYSTLLPELENTYMISLFRREFILPHMMQEVTEQFVKNSRITIIVLSEQYIESAWSQTQFEIIKRTLAKCAKPRVIFISYSDMNFLNDELRNLVKINTYLKYDDNYFWSKLRYAMPHRPVMPKQSDMCNK